MRDPNYKHRSRIAKTEGMTNPRNKLGAPMLILLERIFRRLHAWLNERFPYLNPYFGMLLYNPKLKIKIVKKDYDTSCIRGEYSVIMPVLNEADNIKYVLEAIENQSLRPYELIVVDGGSTDKTLDIINVYKRKLSYKIRISHSKEANIGLQRNIAIGKAKCEILLNIDAGTLPDRDYAANMIIPMLEDKAIDLVGGINYPIEQKPWSRSFSPREHFVASKKPNGNAVAFRKSIAIKAGMYPEFISRAGEDTLFFYRYQRYSRKWLFNKAASVAWYHPATQEEADAKKKNYIRANFEIGLQSYYYYKFKLYRFMTRLYNEFGYVKEHSDEFLKIQSDIEVNKRKIKGLIFVYHEAQLQNAGRSMESYIYKKISENYKVFFIHTGRVRSLKEFYLDTDITLLELYYSCHFELPEMHKRYGDFLNKATFIIPKELSREHERIEILKKSCPDLKILYDIPK